MEAIKNNNWCFSFRAHASNQLSEVRDQTMILILDYLSRLYSIFISLTHTLLKKKE